VLALNLPETKRQALSLLIAELCEENVVLLAVDSGLRTDQLLERAFSQAAESLAHSESILVTDLADCENSLCFRTPQLRKGSAFFLLSFCDDKTTSGQAGFPYLPTALSFSVVEFGPALL